MMSAVDWQPLIGTLAFTVVAAVCVASFALYRWAVNKWPRSW